MITERPLRPSQSGLHAKRSGASKGKLLASVYEARLITPDPVVLKHVEVENRHGDIVVVGVEPEAAVFGIHPGDTLLGRLK